MRNAIPVFCGLFLAAASVRAESVARATLDWADLHRLSVLAAAPVTRVHVRPGQWVADGALLLETDTTVLEAELAAARAALAEEEVRLAEAEREYERNRELYDRTVLSQRDLQLAEAEWKAARRRFAAAQADVRRRERALAWSRIRAPVAGRVVAVHVRPGEMVQSSMQARPLVHLAAGGAMEVVLAWDGTAPPSRIRVRLPEGGEAPAACWIAAAGGGPELRCRFPISDTAAERLWAGMTVEVVLP